MRQYRQSVGREATGKRGLFPSTLAGRDIFPLHVILFPLLPGPRVLLTVAQGIGPLAMEQALGKFSHILVPVGKGHRPLAMTLLVLPGARVAPAIFIRV